MSRAPARASGRPLEARDRRLARRQLRRRVIGVLLAALLGGLIGLVAFAR